MQYTVMDWNDLYDALLMVYQGLDAACKVELRQSLVEEGNDHITAAHEYYDDAVRIANKINQLMEERVLV